MSLNDLRCIESTLYTVDRKEAILDAAVLIADEGGLDAVSMRRVAKQLEAGPMSLYRYVESRDELIESFQATYHPAGELVVAGEVDDEDDIENEELEPDEEIDELD